ncbi:MAG: DUF1275 domain-containing protein [Actinobacteria bacterium]|nr:DUF1275 domain-containing protein [Actinomycetota bacterium]
MVGPADSERTGSLWFALLLTLTNGFLDAHTYLARGGVFANVQTANVIFFAIDTSEHKLAAALAHVWPLLAFIAGMLLASHIKSGRVDRLVARPLLWTMAVQAAALTAIGFVPASVPHSYVTVPISFLAAMQIGLFRKVGHLVYLPVATTGNLMRFMESGYDGFVEKDPASRRAFGVYGALIAAFAGGALIGAVATGAWGTRAIWLPAAFLVVTLALFVVDERILH